MLLCVQIDHLQIGTVEENIFITNLIAQQCIKSAVTNMHTCFSFCLPFLITRLCPLLCCLYKDKYCNSNERLAHNTVCNDRKTRFGIEMCRALFPSYMPQDTYTCAVTPSSPVCLVFALVREQLVYLKHTMRGPLSPCPPSLS